MRLAKRRADQYTVVKPVRNHCLFAERRRHVNQYVVFRVDSVDLGLLRLLQIDIRIRIRVWQSTDDIRHPAL